MADITIAADELIAILDDAAPDAEVAPGGWKVAIVDDDAAVHDGTRYALDKFRLNGRGLTFLSASSAAEGRELLRRHPDVAVVLLDVVMETDEAGLGLVDFVRRELGNETVRIILRTGQPGHAPEQRIVVDYDINDYKAKTELTAEKLFTTMTAALRGYEQLLRLTRMREGLEAIVRAASSLHRTRTVAELGDLALLHLARLFGGPRSGCVLFDLATTGELAVVARVGRYEPAADLGAALAQAVEAAVVGRTVLAVDGACVAFVPAGCHNAVVVFDVADEFGAAERGLLDVFVARLAAAFENVALYEALEEANAVLERKVVERSAQLSAVNARLEAQAEELRRVNALKNELLGIVAHDLKNPLAVILGRAEILSEQLDGPAPDIAGAGAQLDAIRESVHRLSDIISERIADARRDVPEMTLHRRDLDFGALVRRVVEANRAHAHHKGQVLTVAAPPGLIVDADEDRLSEAVDNLVGNALKYTPVGGAVAVAVEAEGAEAVARVMDSGPGIAAGDRARLFGPFQRLSATPTGGESSTGLGLYSAKRIVDLHGGRIALADDAAGGERPPAGACFVLALPLVAAP